MRKDSTFEKLKNLAIFAILANYMNPFWEQ